MTKEEIAESNKCPKCGEPLSASFVATAAKQSAVTFQLTPAPGELFDVSTIGEVLVNFAKLMRISSKELGAPRAITLLKSAEVKEDGSLAFHCLVVRGPDPKNPRKPPTVTA